MLYFLLKPYARLAIRVYLVKVVINRPEVLRTEGPILFAANHPNSFLDGIILSTLFDRPLHTLARGDAFRKNRINGLLRSLFLLPVYRTSEGVENLGHNYTTFEACRRTFEKNGDVLIFSEGRCENEWHLRPLKKGTARLALTSWSEGLPLKVIPTAINYSSFKAFGKEVHLFFGTELPKEKIISEATEGKQLLAFNDELREQLSSMVYEIDDDDVKKQRAVFSYRSAAVWLLALPALLGWIFHAPLYYGCRLVADTWFRNSGHYDSVVTGLLLLTYPLYLILVFILLWVFAAWWCLGVFVFPLLAKACVEVKYTYGL